MGAREYKQLVGNCVRKIQEHSEIKCHHVTSEENPVNFASHGGSVEGVELWWKGPKWLADGEQWPCDIVTVSTAEAKQRLK